MGQNVRFANWLIYRYIDTSTAAAGVPLEAPSNPRLSSVRTKIELNKPKGDSNSLLLFQEWTISYKHMRTTRKKREKIPFAFIVKARFFLVFVFIEGDGGLKKKAWDSSDIQQKNLCERDP